MNLKGFRSKDSDLKEISSLLFSAYGWPMMLMTNKTGALRLCPNLACCAWCCGKPRPSSLNIIEDNCCSCNYAALKNMLNIGEVSPPLILHFHPR